MSDLLGADLQVPSTPEVIEATPVPTPEPAPSAGWSRDASGNLYQEPRQGSTQTAPVPGTPGTEGAEGTAATVDGTGAGQPQTDPTMQAQLQAAQDRAAQAERVAQAAFLRDQAREQATWEARVRQLPADQQRIAIAERRAQMLESQYRQATERQTASQQALEPLYKDIVVSKLVEKYSHAGVNKTVLGRFGSPEAMEEYCKIASEVSKATRNQQRTAAGTDRAVTAGNPARAAAASWKTTSLTDELAKVFAD